MEKVLVTGADGLLGSNLVRILLDRKYAVRALVQPNRKVSTLQGLPLETVQGDILDPASLVPAFGGVDYVIHAAASTSIYPARNPVIWKVNLDGARNVAAQAMQSGVKRLVHIGTANSFGFGSKEQPGKEGNPYEGAQYGLDYMDSKKAAQDFLLASARDGLPIVIVNPTFMIGPYDTAPSSGAMIMALYSGSVPGFAPGGRNYIYVKDAATAVANALTMGKVGECYILGNVNLSYREAFGVIADTIGVRPPRLKFPKVAILAYGALAGLTERISGKSPKVTWPMAKISCDEHYFTAEKAVKGLGLPQTPIEPAIRESFEWLKAHHDLP